VARAGGGQRRPPLAQLRGGDQILISHSDGTTTRFLVGRLEQHPKTALPTSRIWTPAPGRWLRVVTCGGPYSHATGHYLHNVIVYASPTGN
jgi:Sortase domain